MFHSISVCLQKQVIKIGHKFEHGKKGIFYDFGQFLMFSKIFYHFYFLSRTMSDINNRI